MYTAAVVSPLSGGEPGGTPKQWSAVPGASRSWVAVGGSPGRHAR